jgi:hypothetical protein
MICNFYIFFLSLYIFTGSFDVLKQPAQFTSVHKTAATTRSQFPLFSLDQFLTNGKLRNVFTVLTDKNNGFVAPASLQWWWEVRLLSHFLRSFTSRSKPLVLTWLHTCTIRHPITSRATPTSWRPAGGNWEASSGKCYRHPEKKEVWKRSEWGCLRT